MLHPPQVWDGVLERLHTSVPPLVMEAWILPLAVQLEPLASGEGERLHIQAPGAFHEARVRSRFLPAIREALTELGQPDLEVFLCAGDAGGLAAREPQPRSKAASRRRAGSRRAGGTAERRRGTSAGDATAPSRDLSVPTPARSGDAAADAPRPSEPDTRSRTPGPSELPHTFETFVVGDENALGREAALALAQRRQLGISLLFIAGGPGTGKSHLARAIVSEVRSQQANGTAPRGRVVYASAEQFTNAFTLAVRRKDTEPFKERFREGCDLLVLEDLGFLEGKDATQLELFHTLEALAAAGKRVVLTGDRLPREMEGLHPRLVSQITAGLVAEIEPAGRDLRRKIVQRKASNGGVRVPEECIRLLVERAPGTIRDLEGVLIQLVASAALLHRRIDLPLTEAALRKVAPSQGPLLTVATVCERVSSFFGVTREELASRSRKRSILVPRQITIYLCHRYTTATLTDIGRALGRDLPAVKNAIQVVERAILERAPIRYQVEALVERLGITNPVEPAEPAAREDAPRSEAGPTPGPRKVASPRRARPRRQA